MTIRAMAQNRQPSGGYKQEHDHVSCLFSFLTINPPKIPTTCCCRKAAYPSIYLCWLVSPIPPPSSSHNFPITRAIAVAHKGVCFSMRG
ncbi:hypothetical protein CGRA01v4_08899 [Colletotrichum graminicola]|nr:hypothetical protein CGRA01v4_08899 [Colletotrichum graminicola]